jgi:NADPH-dependent glutamate synthase beta subunit-like oxidoreductase
MRNELSWNSRRWVATLLSVIPGLGQAFTGRWSAAVTFFVFGLTPFLFLGFIWRQPDGDSYLLWREFNVGHSIMWAFLFVAWVINLVDTWRGSKPPTAPCIEACPGRIEIPVYINLLLEKRYRDAHELILRRTPLVATLGHVCHHPCESKCTRATFDEPVAICPLKAVIGNRMIADGELPKIAAPAPLRKELRVAVIGSGPAGLSAAFFLARLGIRPTVFESLPKAGGMLVAGIPAYRLPRAVLEAEIDFIRSQGVEILTATHVGRDVPMAELWSRGYKAVLAAPGTHRDTPLRIKGEELDGVLGGAAFLRGVNLGSVTSIDGEVVVIGGGNVAMDAARCALRLGASRVTVLYRRSRREMPANPWEIREAEEENIVFRFLTAPAAIVGSGSVEGIECLEMRLGEPDASGRRRPEPLPGSEFVVPCRHVIAAIGLAPETAFLEGDGVRLDKSGLILLAGRTLATHRPSLFAAGDAVTGPSSVIGASAQGRQAALELFRHLSGHPGYVFRTIKAGATSCDFATRPRVPQKALRADDRTGSFALIHKVYDEELCTQEGRRCLRCDLEM